MNKTDEIFEQNSKVSCYLLKGDAETGYFKVMTLQSGLNGHLNVSPMDPQMPYLFEKVDSKEPVTLYFNYFNRKYSYSQRFDKHHPREKYNLHFSIKKRSDLAKSMFTSYRSFKDE